MTVIDVKRTPGSDVPPADEPVGAADTAARTEAYRKVALHVDRDVLHATLAKHGMELLDAAIPYVVRLVRWRQIDAERRNARSTPIDAVPPMFTAIDDAFERLVRDERLGQVAAALSRLSEVDAYLVWGSADGRDDATLADDLRRMGLVSEVLSASAIRKRRSRALERLRSLMENA